MARGLFEEAYLSLPPWDIGRPQREIIRLAEDGEIQGAVLDAGCGTGENALFLANLGYEVTVVPFTTVLIIVGVLGLYDKTGRSREPLFLSRGVTRFSFPPRRIAVREGSPVAAQTAVFFGV